MIELVYISRSIKRFEQIDLEQLLHHARNKNAGLDITGMLLYDGYGTFIQAMEGPNDNVQSLFEDIKSDQRHTNVNVLGQQKIIKRSFTSWHMSFKLISPVKITPDEAYSHFMTTGKSLTNTQQSFATKMLDYFRNGS